MDVTGLFIMTILKGTPNKKNGFLHHTYILHYAYGTVKSRWRLTKVLPIVTLSWWNQWTTCSIVGP